MRKLILTLAVALGVFASASAQDAGDFWVGGSLGFTSTSIEDADDYVNFKILPEFGYIINEKFGVGISVGYEKQEIDLENLGGTGDIEGFTVSPFVRYAVLKGDIGGLFVDGCVDYSQAKDNDTDTKITGIGVGFRPGVALNVSKNIQLSAKFGYLGYQNIKVGETTANTFGLDLDLSQALFGVSFIF